MLHTAAFFTFFLPLALILERVRSPRARTAVLLAANAVFLSAVSPLVLAWAFGLAFAVWLAGLALAALNSPAARNLLFLTAALGLAALVFLKASSFSLLLGPLVGISFSFFCLPLLGYLGDLWARRVQPERRLLSFVAFATYFPVILSGPVTRAQAFLPQLEGAWERGQARLGEAAELVLRGLFKKLVLADRLADLDNAFLQAGQAGNSILLAPHFHVFMVRTYFDFSGYTDIARGISLCLGVELPVNFDRPFAALNPVDFWRRWHISFSQWLRDYLYYPLFFLTKNLHLCFLLTFLCNGLWHSLEWNFLLLGLFWSAWVSGYLLLRPWWDALPRWLQIGLMWQVFAASFVLFERGGLGILKGIFSGAGSAAEALSFTASQAVPLAWYAFSLAAYLALRWLLPRARGHAPAFLALAFVVAALLFALSTVDSPGYIYSQF